MLGYYSTALLPPQGFPKISEIRQLSIANNFGLLLITWLPAASSQSFSLA
jgi:hypothetical protein